MFPTANKYWPMRVNGHYVVMVNVRIYVSVCAMHIYLVHYARLYIVIKNVFEVNLAF